MNIMKRPLVIFTFLIAYSTCSIAQVELMNGFDLGKYSVGFRHKIFDDFSRSYGDTNRPVQLFIWYPAEGKTILPLRFTDYFLLNKDNKMINEFGLDSILSLEIKRMKVQGDKNVALSKYKNLKTIAQADLDFASGSFPLILFAPGGNTSGQLHSVLCEYLASHGYIVVSTPSLGNAESLKWPFDQTGLNLQVEDMAFVINQIARSSSHLNINKICLISWSVGGVSQGIFAMKNANIDMFISLDSGLGREYGVEMIKNSPYFDYQKMQIPFLHMTGKQPEMYKVERSTEFYDSISSSEKYSIEIEPFAHQHFASQLGYISALVSEKEDKTIVSGYIKMSDLTLTFLDAFLKNNPPAKQEWLKMIEDY
jgi:hypothetical protein